MGAVFLRRHKSTLIDGAGIDARDLSAHLASYLENRSTQKRLSPTSCNSCLRALHGGMPGRSLAGLSSPPRGPHRRKSSLAGISKTAAS
jgi:hypothetical protein